MPRTYRRVTEKASWTSEQLQAAVKSIENGTPIRQAALRFKIPRSSLQKRIKEKSFANPKPYQTSGFKVQDP
ncbi:CENP-B N-terminal DNA-binding domain [Popillia japonica]|uniref:CENP-B N-terminal DNA-binding domain n=1 Tax=Popillia japonica TaxID=7064 RepID=A0AAW1L996_POPJA